MSLNVVYFYFIIKCLLNKMRYCLYIENIKCLFYNDIKWLFI